MDSDLRSECGDPCEDASTDPAVAYRCTMSLRDMLTVLQRFVGPYVSDDPSLMHEGPRVAIALDDFRDAVDGDEVAQFLHDILDRVANQDGPVYLESGDAGTPLFSIACQLALMSCIKNTRRCFCIPVNFMGIQGSSFSLRRALRNALTYDNHVSNDTGKRWSAAALFDYFRDITGGVV